MSTYRGDLDDINDIIQPLLQGGNDDWDAQAVVHETFGGIPTEPIINDHNYIINIPDLKEIYDKVQKKTPNGSEQRIAYGVVNMEIRTTAQISKISVYVRRCEKAAEKTSDTIGAIELTVHLNSCEELDKISFWVDLDSVYKSQTGSYIYWLDRVEVEERNMWELIVITEFIDETKKISQSKPFRIRTKPRPNTKTQDSPQEAHHPSVQDNSTQGRNNETDPLVPPSKRKRSSPSVSSYGTHPSPFSPSFSTKSPGSINNDNESFGPGSVRSSENVVTDYLEAQRANIQHLRVQKMISSPNADIAYHLKLQGPYYRKDFLEEGDVVGFFQNETTGETEIALLSIDNAMQARMAGVISRSAYLHGNVPEVDIEQTDTVCVIGIVKVKVAGPVQNGERIYASMKHPGIGIPETQIPLRAAGNVSPILLGQSLEASSAKDMDVIKPVKCFVSIVMGIQSGQVFNALEDVRRDTRRKITDVIKEEKRKFYRSMLCKGSIILVLLAIITAVLYEFFVPGTWLRYLLCRRGSIPHHDLWFRFYTDDKQTPTVHGIEFKWHELKKRMDLHFNAYNRTGTHYYLNLDRCAYGGIVPVASHLDHKPQVRGAEVVAVDSKCRNVFFESRGTWHRYISVNASAGDIHCSPPYQ